MDLAKTKVYRIRQLPREVKDRLQAAKLLVSLEPRLGRVEDIPLSDLTTDADIWDKKKLKSTIATFKHVPTFLDDSIDTKWTINARAAGIYPQDILLDSHFLDFTVLNDVSPAEHVADLIAISGLASHAFGSWKQRGSDFMWLRDQLPFDLPELRNIIYGYDTQLLKSTSFQTVDDLARMLVRRLKGIGRSSLTAKPLIFCVHSLGGIIFKKALLMLAAFGEAEGRILESIAAILFFGVPSRGMTISHLLPMVEGQPNEQLVEFLRSGSPELVDLDVRFQGLVRRNNLRVVCFYETKTSATTKKTETGTWSRAGPEEILVPRESAILDVAQETDKIPINEDHSNMVKFAPEDQNYKEVLVCLRELVGRSEDGSYSPNAGTTKLSSPRQRPTVISANVGEVSNQVRPSLITDDGNARSEIESRREMMESLRIDRPYDRLEQVRKSHGNTFQWIFDNPSTGFIPWLKCEQGLYWIYGKPGSGKSTFMKYLFQNQLTWETLPGGPEQRVIASFFFHNRGTHLQKSFEGLYRSVIFQIIENHPALQSLVLQIFLQRKPENRRIWAIPDLEDAFQRMLNQDQVSVKIFLFLDALDEYDGPPELIADFVKHATTASATSLTKVQVLFSSRHLNVFQDYFQDKPGLNIQDYTKADIRQYVADQIKQHETLNQLITAFESQSDVNEGGLLEEIIEKAEGVFLWVALAIKEMANASREGVTEPQDIRLKLQSLPTGLEDFYIRIVSHIPADQRSREEAFIMLEIVLRTDGSVTPLQFWNATVCARYDTLQECLPRICTKETSLPIDNLKRQIRSRCGGLLELVEDPSPDSIQRLNDVAAIRSLRIQFMHQTVKEFVGRPDFAKLNFGNDKIANFGNGHTFLTKSMLAGIISSNRDSTYSLRNAMYHAQFSEMTWGRPLYGFFESISNSMIISAFNAYKESIFYGGDLEPDNAVLALAVISDLQLYVDKKLKLESSVNRISKKSLLHRAVDPMVGGLGIYFRTGDLSQMADILLENGADKNALFEGLTPFQVLFKDCGKGLRSWTGSGLSKGTTKTIPIFLKHGQNPDSDILIPRNASTEKAVKYKCKPFHVADTPLVKVLLDYKANINALDDAGRTPLDVAYGVGWNVYEIGDHRRPEDEYSLVMTLLTNGGCITKATLQERPVENKSSLNLFLEIMGRYYNVDPRMKDPPLLQESNNPQGSSIPEGSNNLPQTASPFRRALKAMRSGVKRK